MVVVAEVKVEGEAVVTPSVTSNVEVMVGPAALFVPQDQLAMWSTSGTLNVCEYSWSKSTLRFISAAKLMCSHPLSISLGSRGECLLAFIQSHSEQWVRFVEDGQGTT